MIFRTFDGLQDYQESLQKMTDLSSSVISGISDGEVWLLEHDHVFTKGVSGNSSDAIGDIKIVETNRGGKLTYHGPGQLICYTILDLKKFYKTPDVRDYVKRIESIIISTLAIYRIEAYLKDGLIGVWTLNPANNREEKIAAIGLKVKKWCVYHGFSLNLSPDMSKFQSIVPCGISPLEYGVCSFETLGVDFDRTTVISQITEQFKTHF